ncbi:MAG TPA: hypothetical protein VFY91_13470 [Microbacterium sp.]|nr:hypothetical protein [Microbacterium sp.]
MTAMPSADAPAPALRRRRADVWGIVAVILGIVGLAPSLAIFLIGLLPDMQMIFWLLIVTIPILGIGGAIALILGVIGIIVGVRRGTRYVWSAVGVALGILMLIPIALLYFGQSV